MELKFRVWENGAKTFLPTLNNLEFRPSFLLQEYSPISEFLKRADGWFVVQQWTGLQDSTGKDIYEGDILQFHKGKPYQSEYEVYWRNCGFSLISAKRKGDKYGVFTKNLGNLCPADKPVIIGNRYENSELLA